MKTKLKPLHLACLYNESMPNHALIGISNKIATAYNGAILVKLDLSVVTSLLPEELDMIEGKYIHGEVWKEIHKCDELRFEEETIICYKNGIKKVFEYSQPNGEIFNTNTIVRDIKEAGEQGQRLICYNPKQIVILAKVFDHDEMRFSTTKGNKGTIVFPYQDSGMFAVLFTTNIEAENRYFFE